MFCCQFDLGKHQTLQFTGIDINLEDMGRVGNIEARFSNDAPLAIPRKHLVRITNRNRVFVLVPGNADERPFERQEGLVVQRTHPDRHRLFGQIALNHSNPFQP